MVEAANFQVSWDQDLSADEATVMLEQLSRFFLGEIGAQGFVAALAS